MKTCRNEKCKMKGLGSDKYNGFCSSKCTAEKMIGCKNGDCKELWNSETWDPSLKGFCSEKCKNRKFDKDQANFTKSEEYDPTMPALSMMFFDKTLQKREFRPSVEKNEFKVRKIEKINDNEFMVKFQNENSESFEIKLPEPELRNLKLFDRYKMLIGKEFLVPYSEK